MHLSSWELNQKAPHPKHLENIINYLDYIPKMKSKFERIGTRTKLYRLKHQLTLKDFIQMTNIDNNVVNKIENYRFCKLEKYVLHQIEKAIKQKPTFSYAENLK